MNKTIYLTKADVADYERAQRLARLKGYAGIGEYIMALLRKDAIEIGETAGSEG